MEEWKEVYGFDVLYEISNMGRLRTKHDSHKGYQKDYKYLTPTDNGNGYLRVNIKRKSKQTTVYIHKLVAEAFIDNPQGYCEVNHKDENKTNNNVSNLEWISHIDNCNYGTRNERVALKHGRFVRCNEKNIIYASIQKAAEDTGVVITAISNCLNGRSKTCAGYTWSYVDVQ